MQQTAREGVGRTLAPQPPRLRCAIVRTHFFAKLAEASPMSTACVLVAAALSWATPPQQLITRRISAVARAPAPRAAEALKPFRSDANFDYFRSSRQMSVTLPKPLGAVLQEAPATASGPAGVKVEDLNEGGSAFDTLKKGDKLTSIMGTDVSTSDFDAVMELLIAAPEEVELNILRTVLVRKPRVPSALTVDGEVVQVTKGVIMRTAIQEKGLEVHKGAKAKMSQCGGAGQCASCWVEVLDGMDNLSDPSDAELRMRKQRPETWRMACQSFVNGDVSVQVKSLEKPP